MSLEEVSLMDITSLDYHDHERCKPLLSSFYRLLRREMPLARGKRWVADWNGIIGSGRHRRYTRPDVDRLPNEATAGPQWQRQLCIN